MDRKTTPLPPHLPAHRRHQSESIPKPVGPARAQQSVVSAPRPPNLSNGLPAPGEPVPLSARRATTSDAKQATVAADSKAGGARRTSLLLQNAVFREFRINERKGYMQMRVAAGNLSAQFGDTTNPSIIKLNKLLKTLEEFHNEYLNPASSLAAPVPAEMCRDLDSMRNALSDMQRGRLALKEEDRTNLKNLQDRTVVVLKSIQHHADAEISEVRIGEKFLTLYPTDTLNPEAFLDRLLSDPREGIALKELRLLCEKRHITENLDFLIAVRAAKQSDSLELLKAYQVIFKDFIAPEAPRQVNLPDTMCKKIDAALNHLASAQTSSSTGASEATADALAQAHQAMEEARKEIAKLFSANTMREFIRPAPTLPRPPATSRSPAT